MLERRHFIIGCCVVKAPIQRPHCSMDQKRESLKEGALTVLGAMRLPWLRNKSIPSLLMAPTICKQLE